MSLECANSAFREVISVFMTCLWLFCNLANWPISFQFAGGSSNKIKEFYANKIVKCGVISELLQEIAVCEET